MVQGRNEKNAQTLLELHSVSHVIDTIFSQPESTNFSNTVKLEIAEIQSNHLNKDIENWGSKCKQARLSSGLSQEYVAEKMHIDHSIIVRQEKITKKCEVKLFYLEAFALLYHITPMVLLGVQPPKLNLVTTSDDALASGYQNLILNTLYDPKDPNKIYFLQTISHIGNLRFSAELMVKAVLAQLPAFKDILRADPKDLPITQSTHWLSQAPKPLDYSQNDTIEYAIDYVYWEAFVTTGRLVSQRNISKLRLMAQLALADSSLLKLLTDICNIGGITSNPRALTSISLDHIVCNAPPKAKLEPRNPVQYHSEIPSHPADILKSHI